MAVSPSFKYPTAYCILDKRILPIIDDPIFGNLKPSVTGKGTFSIDPAVTGFTIDSTTGEITPPKNLSSSMSLTVKFKPTAKDVISKVFTVFSTKAFNSNNNPTNNSYIPIGYVIALIGTIIVPSAAVPKEYNNVIEVPSNTTDLNSITAFPEVGISGFTYMNYQAIDPWDGYTMGSQGRIIITKIPTKNIRLKVYFENTFGIKTLDVLIVNKVEYQIDNIAEKIMTLDLTGETITENNTTYEIGAYVKKTLNNVIQAADIGRPDFDLYHKHIIEDYSRKNVEKYPFQYILYRDINLSLLEGEIQNLNASHFPQNSYLHKGVWNNEYCTTIWQALSVSLSMGALKNLTNDGSPLVGQDYTSDPGDITQYKNGTNISLRTILYRVMAIVIRRKFLDPLIGDNKGKLEAIYGKYTEKLTTFLSTIDPTSTTPDMLFYYYIKLVALTNLTDSEIDDATEAINTLITANAKQLQLQLPDGTDVTDGIYASLSNTEESLTSGVLTIAVPTWTQYFHWWTISNTPLESDELLFDYDLSNIKTATRPEYPDSQYYVNAWLVWTEKYMGFVPDPHTNKDDSYGRMFLAQWALDILDVLSQVTPPTTSTSYQAIGGLSSLLSLGVEPDILVASTIQIPTNYTYVAQAILIALTVAGDAIAAKSEAIGSMAEKDMEAYLGAVPATAEASELTQLVFQKSQYSNIEYSSSSFYTSLINFIGQIPAPNSAQLATVSDPATGLATLYQKYKSNPLISYVYKDMLSLHADQMANMIELPWRVFPMEGDTPLASYTTAVGTAPMKTMALTVHRLSMNSASVLQADTVSNMNLNMKVYLQSDSEILFKKLSSQSTRTSSDTEYYFDTVSYFDEVNLREDLGAASLKLFFSFSAQDAGGNTQNYSCIQELNTIGSRIYKLANAAVKDEAGNVCGRLSFDTRLLTATEKAAEDANYTSWQATVDQPTAKTTFAYQLGTTWGDIVNFFLSVYPAKMEAFMDTLED